MSHQRVRIRFSKHGDLRFISHRDLLRTLERLFRRADLRLGMSQGFHPKPRMTFPAALPVGVVGASEIMELELAGALSADEIRDRLVAQSVPGLTIASVEVLPPGAKKIRVCSLSFEIPVPADRHAEVDRQLRWLWEQESYLDRREDGSAAVDIRPALVELTLTDDRLCMRLRVDAQGGARPRAVLAALGIGDLPQQGCVLTRTAVELAS